MSLPELTPEKSLFEQRYQTVVAQYFHAQAQFKEAKHECDRLRVIVGLKQEVIEVLLPHYPHRLSAELKRRIALR